MATRIYVVTDNSNKEKLVEASTPSGALRHVAKTYFDVRVASQKDIVQLMKDGQEVETATVQEEQTDLPLTSEGEVV